MADMVTVRYDAPTLPVAGSATSMAKALVVDSQEMYEFADKQMVSVKRQAKEFEAQRKEIVDPINKAKDAVQALFRPVLDDLAEAEGCYKRAMLGYQQEQDRMRRAEQARLDEEARIAREKLEAQAAKAAAKGHTEKAEVLAATAAVTTAPIATSTYVAPKGLSVKKTWKARVVDKAALLRSVLDNPSFMHLVEIDGGALDKLAKAMEGHVPLAGVECFEEESLARRAV